jgi:hypothetical protein
MINQSPYLRVQRNFPTENIQALTVEIDRAYVDTAIKVNSRTIGVFALGNQLITGEKYYLTGQPNGQQGLRQIYTFNAASLNFVHNLNLSTISYFSRIYGSFTNGTNWYPMPYVDATAATNQVSVVITPTNIVITAGSGAPTITSGVIVLEWVSQF